VIPEIDLCRVANLMLTRFGDNAEVESAVRADELTAAGDHDGAECQTNNRQLTDRGEFAQRRRASL
jgi:hypothetical protein